MSDSLLLFIHVSYPKWHRNAVRNPHQEAVRCRQADQKGKEYQEGDPCDDRCLDHELSFQRSPRVLDAAVGAECTTCKTKDTPENPANISNLRSGKHICNIGSWVGNVNVLEVSSRIS